MSTNYPTQPQQEPMSQQPYHGWPTPSAPQPPKKRNWFRRHPVWTVVLAVAGIIIIATAAGGGGSTTEDTGDHNTFSTNADRPNNKIKHDRPEPKPEPAYTTSQEQAIGAAEDYLNTMPFSKRGLISQLSSEYGSQFDEADARFAVRHLDVDWNQQAVEAGQDYLDTMSFSPEGLKDQLSSPYGSQFTEAQAQYAVNKLF